MSLPKQISVLLLISVLISFATQFVLPNRSAWRGNWNRFVESKASEGGIDTATLADAKEIVDAQSHIILDARSPADYENGHLPGALSLPQEQKNDYLDQVIPLLTPEQPIMTYCSGQECDESFALSVFLKEHGYTNLVLFAGGMTDWQKAGYPIEGVGP